MKRKTTEQLDGAPRIIKKYPNRRLYDTSASAYITLVDVKRLVVAGASFVVRDARTGEDLTRSILLQVILEEEIKGAPMFTVDVLACLIRCYGHEMQKIFEEHLEKSMQTLQYQLTPDSRGQLQVA